MITILEATRVASARDYRDLPAPIYAGVAFVGRSNVGKSSLVNALLQRHKLLRTSSTPGCTRGIDVVRVRVRTSPKAADPTETVFELVDLPGYGFAQRSKTERRAWGPMVEDVLRRRAGIRAVVLIVDARRGIGPDDEQLLEFVRSCGLDAIVVATKLDKLRKNEQKPALASLRQQHDVPLVGCSAEGRIGLDALWDRILTKLAVAPEAPTS